MHTLSAALEQACRRFGPAVAVLGGPIRLAYAELDERARAVASMLQDAGLDANEPVHVHVSNQPHDIVALFGVWLAGGVAVPVHRTTPAAVAATSCSV
jgi:long-chain acyl-CoA synthetase